MRRFVTGSAIGSVQQDMASTKKAICKDCGKAITLPWPYYTETGKINDHQLSCSE